MKTILQHKLALVALCLAMQGSAQKIEGELHLNGKAKMELELETNSVVQLFKDFKTRKYQLQFRYDATDIPLNRYNETIVFFDFITQVKKDGKLLKEIRREEPFPYFPGDMFLAPETFDFISILSNIDGNNQKSPKNYGTMPPGNYSLVLLIEPKGFKGRIAPLEIYFALRKRPTR
ncbi:hypothetical protein [Spongiimicrobium salis]|uniref:hypothetical protein n=1 Tax=Spongiimicrobium salis TaxID=1667022 RepID=UPI00374C8CE3